MIPAPRPRPETFETPAKTLFAAMRIGGYVGFEAVEWLDGGLFGNEDALPQLGKIRTTWSVPQRRTGPTLACISVTPCLNAA